MNNYKLVPVELIDRFPEINPSNYDHDDACTLNAWGVELVLAAVDAPAVQGEPVAWRYRPSTFHPDHKDLIIEPLYAAPQPAEQKPFEWPLLDAPALIGGVVVGKGCSTGTVVAIAKRKHQCEVETGPEEHARRERALKDMLRQIHEGIGQQPAEQQPVYQRCEYCDGTGDVHSIDGEWRGACDCQQPAPDVDVLVEALTMARETIASALRANAPDYFTTDADIARHVVIQRVDTALAAHRREPSHDNQ